MKILLPLLCCSIASSQMPGLNEVADVARTYFRESTELPMDVSITTTVRNPDGTLKREGHADVHMLFQGYGRDGRFAVSTKGGLLKQMAVHESVSGDLAAFAAGALLIRKRDTAHFDLQPSAGQGKAFLLRIDDRDCPEFKLISERILFPPARAFCGEATYTLTGDEASGLNFEHFRWAASNLPAHVKTGELGDLEMLSYRIEEEFQSWNPPGDATPFLLPRVVHIFMTTDRGSIDFTNQYTPTPAK